MNVLTNKTYKSKPKLELKIYIKPFQVHSLCSGGLPQMPRYTMLMYYKGAQPSSQLQRQLLKTLRILPRKNRKMDNTKQNNSGEGIENR